MRALVRPLSLAATTGMFLVVVMGATVTNTGSAAGCGRSWPLCNGQVIPEFAVATLIEFSHRAVTGVETVLLITFAVGVWLTDRQHLEIRVLAPLMVGTLVLQALMGAWAVVYPQTPGVLASHFGISLAAFASVLLATTFIRAADSGDRSRARGVSVAYRWTVWATLLYVGIVVYLGAYIRHAGYELACGGWPLCNGALFPGLSGPVGIAFAHRLAALGSVLLLAGLAVWSMRLRKTRPDLTRGSLVALALVLLQSLSGGLVAVTHVGLFSALSHAGLMALLFGSVSYLCLQSLPARRVESPVVAPLRQESVVRGSS